jgi:polyphosphate kinase
MAMVVRREEHGIRRYVHLGTGNYHPRTAKLYTDFGLLTCHEDLCNDVSEVFHQLTGLGKAVRLKHLWQSPFTLHTNLIHAIQREADNAKAGKKAQVIAKMNSLMEPKIIEAMYAASCAGVQIDLIVRGVCALRPGMPGVSENIRVRSVVGRFLEHSRIFFFHADGEEHLYLSSADWMSRNFFRRIETCFPILDAKLKRRVMREGLLPFLKDNQQAWDMDAKGNYSRRPQRRSQPYTAQTALLEMLGKLTK